MGERMGRIGQIDTDFFLLKSSDFKQKIKKIRINLPDPPHPFSHCISIFQIEKRCNLRRKATLAQ
jgi:hypothetical protein